MKNLEEILEMVRKMTMEERIMLCFADDQVRKEWIKNWTAWTKTATVEEIAAAQKQNKEAIDRATEQIKSYKNKK